MQKSNQLVKDLEVFLLRANQSCWTIRQIKEVTGESDNDIKLNKLLDLEKERLLFYMTGIIETMSQLTEDKFFINNSNQIK
jgi:hypothetical protein